MFFEHYLKFISDLFFEEYNSPEEWVKIVKDRGYTAVSTPIEEDATQEEIVAYREAAEANDLLMDQMQKQIH